MKRFLCLLGATVVALGVAAVNPAAGAAGTWTRITSPQGPGHRLYPIGDNTYLRNISGVASADITALDVYCFWDSGRSYFGPINTVSPLTPAADHTFHATINVGSISACVL